jgi:hypothetical protein
MYKTTLVIDYEPLTLDDILSKVLDTWNKMVEEEQLEEFYERYYNYKITDKSSLYLRWYSRKDKKSVRKSDSKRHKKPRYDYHKARA